MPGQISEGAFGKWIGAPVMTALGAGLTLLSAGKGGHPNASLAALLAVVGGIGGLVFSMLYRRNLALLAASGMRSGTAERYAYDEFRDGLAGASLASRLYARWLTAFLDRVDRFFGDAEHADRTLFPTAFGLRTPAPLWTAPAFVRCLLLALAYPILSVFLIWVLSGYVGRAEKALQLPAELHSWQRFLELAAVTFVIFAYGRPRKERRRRSPAWHTVAFSVLIAIVFADAFAVYVLVAVAVAFDDAGAVAWINNRAVERQRHGLFLLLLCPAMIVACLGGARFLASSAGWERSGPLLLFLGLLTVLNAPFDWASLGLTRALLRRGLELGGWWPCLLALLGALLAAVIVALLTLAMVVSVQAFDALAVAGGGAPVLPLGPLIDGIEAHPKAPEYWWLYALLLSTMIPSIINLMIGGASLLRGFPGLSPLLLRFMPAGQKVLFLNRIWLAPVLTLQVVGGAALGIVVGVAMIWGVIGYAMPWFGVGLLEMARDLTAANLPLRALQLAGGG